MVLFVYDAHVTPADWRQPVRIDVTGRVPPSTRCGCSNLSRQATTNGRVLALLLISFITIYNTAYPAVTIGRGIVPVVLGAVQVTSSFDGDAGVTPGIPVIPCPMHDPAKSTGRSGVGSGAHVRC